jgi:hypothetical protein
MLAAQWLTAPLRDGTRIGAASDVHLVVLGRRVEVAMSVVSGYAESYVPYGHVHPGHGAVFRLGW